MHFDDRLGTVLRQRADSELIARIQYRQLLDLLGTLPAEARSDQIDAAYARIAALAQAIPAAARAAMLRESGLRLRSPRLVAELAAAEPQVAIAAIRRAVLDADQWLDLAPALAPHARSVMRAREDLPPVVLERLARLGIFDRALPPAKDVGIPTAAAVEPPSASSPDLSAQDSVNLSTSAAGAQDTIDGPEPFAEGIGALVRRIESFRKAREDGDSPRLPLDEERGRPRAFDFWTDGDGRIVSADVPIAPMVVGIPLAARDGTASVPEAFRLAFRRRLPIRAIVIDLAGADAVAGAWQVDAEPVFHPLGGRFTGYAGRMRRPAPVETSAALPVGAEADRIRQLLHELRTPVNAIQGFAEVIQQQLFGPTPHEYRALAATIAGDAARMLAGFEELERLAKLDEGALAIEPGNCDIAAIFAAAASQLRPFTDARGSRFALELGNVPLIVGIATAEAERIAWRILATLAGAAETGEVLNLHVYPAGGRATLSIDLPAGLAARAGEELFHAITGLTRSNDAAADQIPAPSAGMFGAGFSLRLARAEALAAGGTLERHGDALHLALPPLLSESAASQSRAGRNRGGPSHGDESQGGSAETIRNF